MKNIQRISLRLDGNGEKAIRMVRQFQLVYPMIRITGGISRNGDFK